MALSLNQFSPNEPVAGLYVYMANLPQLHNLIVSAPENAPLMAGAVVTIDNAATNTNAPVVKQAGVTDKIFGVVTYNPIQNQFIAGERIAIARANDIIWMPAAGAIEAGAELYFTANNQVTATATAGNSIIGKALTPATTTDDFVQVELGFKTTEAAAEGGS